MFEGHGRQAVDGVGREKKAILAVMTRVESYTPEEIRLQAAAAKPPQTKRLKPEGARVDPGVAGPSLECLANLDAGEFRVFGVFGGETPRHFRTRRLQLEAHERRRLSASRPRGRTDDHLCECPRLLLRSKTHRNKSQNQPNEAKPLHASPSDVRRCYGDARAGQPCTHLLPDQGPGAT